LYQAHSVVFGGAKWLLSRLERLLQPDEHAALCAPLQLTAAKASAPRNNNRSGKALVGIGGDGVCRGPGQ